MGRLRLLRGLVGILFCLSMELRKAFHSSIQPGVKVVKGLSHCLQYVYRTLPHHKHTQSQTQGSILVHISKPSYEYVTLPPPSNIHISSHPLMTLPLPSHNSFTKCLIFYSLITSLPTKPATDPALGLRSLLLDGAVESFNVLHGFLFGVGFILLEFGFGFGSFGAGLIYLWVC